MIQSLPSRKNEWVVSWVDLEEIVVNAGEVLLPTFVAITNAEGIALGPGECLKELDQPKVEQALGRLVDKHGRPECITLRSSPDWDQEAWKEFSRETGITIRYRDFQPETIIEISIASGSPPSRKKGGKSDDGLAEALLQTAATLRSPSRREAYLKKCLQLDPGMQTAKVDLADIEFSRGEWKSCLAAYEEVLRAVSAERKLNWENPAHRPALRALHGKGMTLWHLGRHSDAAATFENALRLCPSDNQGARFFLPMLHLLAGNLEEAAAFFGRYEKRYPGDLRDPAMLLGWAFTLEAVGEESLAKTKYREGMLRNFYLAPMLLELPEPSGQLWLPSDRAEPSYAAEFVDSFAVLWDQSPGSLRMVREVWEQIAGEVKILVEHRRKMLEFQDQRYDPDYRRKWEEFVRKDDELISGAPSP